MRILSLDQSTKITGFAVFDEQTLVASGKFTLDDPDLGTRLTQFRNRIQSLITDYEIDKVYFEDIQLQPVGGVTTYKALAEVYGVLEELLTSLNVPYEAVFSSEWKSTLSIKGKQRAEQKRNAQAYVATTYNKKVTQDESDAICIGTHILKKNESAF